MERDAMAEKATIEHFAAANPREYERFADELEWLIPYLVNDFDLDHYLYIAPDPRDKTRLQAWKMCIIRDLTREFAWSRQRTSKSKQGSASTDLFFEGSFHWFLQYETQTDTVEGSASRRRLWGGVKYLFGYQYTPAVPCTNDGLNTVNNDILEEAIQLENESQSECDSESSEGDLLVSPTQSISNSLPPRLTRELDRAEEFLDTQDRSTFLPSLGCIDRMAVLNHILEQVKKDHARYSHLFNSSSSSSIMDELDRGLSPAVKDMCHSGLFDFQHLRELGNDPTNRKEAGVYLHILWIKNQSQPPPFWLYVGQAADLSARIQNHCDNRYRSRHFSLHYHVWNSSEVMDSRFAGLYLAPQATDRNQRLYLNLAEMWMACIFQTLTRPYLEQYLPQSISIRWGGCHLNVALPLWQSLPGGLDEDEVVTDTGTQGARAVFTSLLQSPDDAIRRWAESWRDGFNELRNSPDKRLRSYYKGHIARSLELANAEQEAQMLSRYQTYLQGKNLPVKLIPKASMCYKVFIGQFPFSVNHEFGLRFEEGDHAFVQLHLFEGTHPMAYARRALLTDPASRLAISVQGHDRCGEFHVWLANHRGINAVQKMNHLVDILEGYSLKEIKGFRRRWISSLVRTENGSRVRKTVYTE